MSSSILHEPRRSSHKANHRGVPLRNEGKFSTTWSNVGQELPRFLDCARAFVFALELRVPSSHLGGWGVGGVPTADFVRAGLTIRPRTHMNIPEHSLELSRMPGARARNFTSPAFGLKKPASRSRSPAQAAQP